MTGIPESRNSYQKALTMSENETSTMTGRLRKASVSAADAILSFNPQPGMWAATGTAIAYAPTLTELREPVAGGDNIEFNGHGHSARTVMKDEGGLPVLSTTRTSTGEEKQATAPRMVRRQTLKEQALAEGKEKHTWLETLGNAGKAAWKFVSSPTGFFITIYGLNVVACKYHKLPTISPHQRNI